MGRKRIPLDQRIRDRAKVDPETGCWEWQNARSEYGYGRIGLFLDGKRTYHHVHRVAYELYVGPIPEGLVIDHLCRNPPCCNPEHLEPVTQDENVRRGDSPINAFRDITHCKRGHEFTPENTYQMPKGRYCRECGRQRSREYVARKKANA